MGWQIVEGGGRLSRSIRPVSRWPGWLVPLRSKAVITVVEALGTDSGSGPIWLVLASQWWLRVPLEFCGMICRSGACHGPRTVVLGLLEHLDGTHGADWR